MIFFRVGLEKQLRFIAWKVNLVQFDQDKGYLKGLGMRGGCSQSTFFYSFQFILPSPSNLRYSFLFH